jgi:hypothetical protein
MRSADCAISHLMSSGTYPLVTRFFGDQILETYLTSANATLQGDPRRDRLFVTASEQDP